MRGDDLLEAEQRLLVARDLREAEPDVVVELGAGRELLLGLAELGEGLLGPVGVVQPDAALEPLVHLKRASR